jgi:hypothetical protein
VSARPVTNPPTASMRTGTLVISLDFELMWGVRDKLSLAEYGQNILGVRAVVPALLRLFAERNIACTWATVGFLFFDKKRDLLAGLPNRRPVYANPRFSPYGDLSTIGDNEDADPYHYGLSLIRQVMDCPRQEIGTHTFSHFYCLEDGGDAETFRADLEAAHAAADRLDIRLKSIVFPRNQWNESHLRVCGDLGLQSCRGNETAWFHRPRRDADQKLYVRGVRLADAYLPIGGPHDCEPSLVDGLVNVPSSRFLRPVRNEPISEWLRLKRITSAMEMAARRKRVFHLWWHPHNFGLGLEASITFLRGILDQFRLLQDRYGMRSLNMGEIADEVLHPAARKTDRTGDGKGSTPEDGFSTTVASA